MPPTDFDPRLDSLEAARTRASEAHGKALETRNAADDAHRRLDEARAALPDDEDARENEILDRPKKVPKAVVELAREAGRADLAAEAAARAAAKLDAELARVEAEAPAQMRRRLRALDEEDMRAAFGHLHAAAPILERIASRTDAASTYLKATSSNGRMMGDIVQRSIVLLVTQARDYLREAALDAEIKLDDDALPRFESLGRTMRNSMRAIDERMARRPTS